MQYGSRAYYGVPLLAPDFSGTADAQIPIGTLCVIDDKPRDVFTAEQRSKMGDLALLAQKTIANWSRARLQARLDQLDQSLLVWKNETSSLNGADMNGFASRQKAIQAGPEPEEPRKMKANGNGNASDEVEILHISRPTATTATPTGLAAVSSEPSPALSDAMSGSSYYTAPQQPHNRQKIYDISTRLVATSLELTLVYILRLDMAAPSPLGFGSQPAVDAVRGLSLVSHYGLPSPEPAFDSVLHLKALKSEEGGLLYQNPDIEELVAGERLPHSDQVEYAVSGGHERRAITNTMPRRHLTFVLFSSLSLSPSPSFSLSFSRLSLSLSMNTRRQATSSQASPTIPSASLRETTCCISLPSHRSSPSTSE